MSTYNPPLTWIRVLYSCRIFGINFQEVKQNLKESRSTLGKWQKQAIFLFGGTQLYPRPQRTPTGNIINKMSNSQSKMHKS